MPGKTASIWRTMGILNHHFGFFTTRAVLDILGNSERRLVEGYIAFLKRESVIEITEAERQTSVTAFRFRLVRDGEAPPLPTGEKARMRECRQALWTAIRGLRQFSPAELALAASTENLAVRGAVQPFLAALTGAGYLDRLTPSVYRLRRARDTGPRAPILTSEDGSLFDLNLMRAVNVTAQSSLQHGGRAA